jgi:hypothetical protein
MPQFTLDLRWTPKGLANVPSEKFRIREEAKAEAKDKNITIISITDRLHPPVGPLWVVEGQESDVTALVKKFNEEKHVTATAQII